MVDTVTDTNSCRTADSAVSEIENRHHHWSSSNQFY